MTRPPPIALITMAQALAHLNWDPGAPTTDIQFKIYLASEAVMAYLKLQGTADFTDTAGYPLEDSSGAPIVPWRVYGATCLMLGYLISQKDSSEDFQMGYLPPAVTALLYQMRDPALR